MDGCFAKAGNSGDLSLCESGFGKRKDATGLRVAIEPSNPDKPIVSQKRSRDARELVVAQMASQRAATKRHGRRAARFAELDKRLDAAQQPKRETGVYVRIS